MPWQLSQALFYVASVSRALFQRRYLRKTQVASSVTAAFVGLLGIWPISIVVGLLLPHNVNWSWWLVGLLAIEGVAIGLYNKLAFRAIKRLPIAQFQTLNQSSTIFLILLSWLILGETLSITQLMGAGLIITSAIVAAFAHHRKSKKTGEPGAIKLVIIAAALLSIGLIAEKAAIGHMDIGAYFIYGFGAQMLCAVLIASKDIRIDTVRRFTLSDIRNFVFIGIISAFAGFLYLYTVKTVNNIALVVSLNAFVLPLTALASFWLLKEKENQRDLWVAIALGVTGIIITTL